MKINLNISKNINEDMDKDMDTNSDTPMNRNTGPDSYMDKSTETDTDMSIYTTFVHWMSGCSEIELFRYSVSSDIGKRVLYSVNIFPISD
jgi:hypothetical protein